MAPFCHNLEGQDPTYAPEFTFNLGAQYAIPLGDEDTLTPRINYGHVSSQWATLFEVQDALRNDKIEARDIINAQLAEGLEDIRKGRVSRPFDSVEEMLASLKGSSPKRPRKAARTAKIRPR